MTAKREEIDRVHSESVQEIVPMQYTEESVDLISKVLVSIMMSLSLSNKGKSSKLRQYDISRAYFQGTIERLIHIRLPQKIVRNVTKTKLAENGQERVWNSGCFPHLAAWWCESDLWRVRRVFEEANTGSAASFHNPDQDVRMAMHGDNFE